MYPHENVICFSLQVKSETFLHPEPIHVLKYEVFFFGLILTKFE